MFLKFYKTFHVIRSYQLNSNRPNAEQRNQLAQKLKQLKNVILNNYLVSLICFSHHTKNAIHEYAGAQE